MTVRAVTDRMLGALAFDIRSGQACTLLARFFSNYERWFDLIGGECRTLRISCSCGSTPLTPFAELQRS